MQHVDSRIQCQYTENQLVMCSCSLLQSVTDKLCCAARCCKFSLTPAVLLQPIQEAEAVSSVHKLQQSASLLRCVLQFALSPVISARLAQRQ
jgi:hypothetical protein